MSALAAERDTKERRGLIHAYPVQAGAVLYAGGIGVLEAGYLCPAYEATGLVTVGRIRASADNSAGNDGDIQAEVQEGEFYYANSSGADLIAQADVGAVCYVVDDQTVAKTDGGGARSAAGKINGVDAGGVWVLMSPATA